MGSLQQVVQGGAQEGEELWKPWARGLPGVILPGADGQPRTELHLSPFEFLDLLGRHEACRLL